MAKAGPEGDTESPRRKRYPYLAHTYSKTRFLIGRRKESWPETGTNANCNTGGK